MKKEYIIPTLRIVTIGNRPICETIMVGSGVSKCGNGTQLGREDNSWDIWGNDNTEFDD